MTDYKGVEKMEVGHLDRRKEQTMAKHIENEVAYYYDSHPTPEDLMGETGIHRKLVHYLEEVLKWLFWGQVCTIHGNLNFYQTSEIKERPLAPDIAVIKGVILPDETSWQVGTTGSAPQVVFEVASKETWKKDLEQKPVRYAQMGVVEYFAYDPNVPPLPLSLERGRRLFGWQLGHGAREMRLDADGWLWSPQLESYLVPDGPYLRLYDRFRNLRLTREEMLDRRAEAEAEAMRVLLEKLRSRGIDPDQL